MNSPNPMELTVQVGAKNGSSARLLQMAAPTKRVSPQSVHGAEAPKQPAIVQANFIPEILALEMIRELKPGASETLLDCRCPEGHVETTLIRSQGHRHVAFPRLSQGGSAGSTAQSLLLRCLNAKTTLAHASTTGALMCG